MGGPDAFDASSAHGAYSAMMDDVDVLSRYDRKYILNQFNTVLCS